MSEVTIRVALAADAPFLMQMLLAAMNWDPARPQADERVVRARPELRHYVDGWPRPTDVGVVAEADGRPIGAAWLRRFGPDDPGYGFVGPDVPELTIAVAGAWRGLGVGARLLDAVLAAGQRRGSDRVSLSVEPGNRTAAALYRSRGFRDVGTNGGAVTMLVELASRAADQG